MTWIDRYSLLSYTDGGRDFDGVDCWGLVRLVYACELNISLPSYGEISAEDLIRASRNINNGKDGEDWIDVPASDIQEFDVCCMRFIGSRLVGHVGIVIDRNVIMHIERGQDVAIVPLKHFTIRERVACFRRHKLKTK